jgi:hypothetical protein
LYSEIKRIRGNRKEIWGGGGEKGRKVGRWEREEGGADVGEKSGEGRTVKDCYAITNGCG